MLTIHGMDVRMIDTIRPMSTWKCSVHHSARRPSAPRRGGGRHNPYTRITQPSVKKEELIAKQARSQSETYSVNNAKKGERGCRIRVNSNSGSRLLVKRALFPARLYVGIPLLTPYYPQARWYSCLRLAYIREGNASILRPTAAVPRPCSPATETQKKQPSYAAVPSVQQPSPVFSLTPKNAHTLLRKKPTA